MNRMTQGVRLAFAPCWIMLAMIWLVLHAPAHAAEALPADGPAAQALQKDAVCTRCHDESETRQILAIYQTRHGVKGDARTPSCQSCHGESAKHVAGGQKEGNASRPAPDVIYKTSTTVGHASDPQLQAETCMGCHKAGKRTHWDGSQHEARGVPCAACHSVHVKSDPVLTKVTQAEVCFACHKTERAQTHRVSTHPIAAGKVACSDCHNPHGTTGPKLLVKNSVNDTCYSCHADKRGPFLWEHGPVADDCTNCHTPHGSSNTPLLKARAPMLCQQCHSGDHGAQINSGANFADGNVTTVGGILSPYKATAAARAQLAGRACLNCHVLVHGSNHPAGSKFQR
jgi:DmsE family decaheme c-type cytochrome